MATAACTTCAKEISKQAPSCPHCGQPNPTMKAGARNVWYLVVVGLFGWWFFGGGLMSHAENEVVKQALAQYDIAQRSGDPIQICVHAGFVSAAYMQAKDEGNYQKWLATEKQACRTASVPR